MEFFKILHLLLISPAHLVYEIKVSSFRKLFLKVFSLLLFVIVVSSFFNTYRTTSRMPAELVEMFPNTKIENGKMQIDSAYSIRSWQLTKALSFITGTGTSSATEGEIAISVVKELPSVKDSALITYFYEDGLTLNESWFPLITKGIHTDTLSWFTIGEYFGDTDGSFGFTAVEFQQVLKKKRITIFILSLIYSFVSLLVLSLYVYLLLGIAFFFSSLRTLIPKKERAKMVLLSLLPMYILLPVFITAGAGWEYFMPINLILSSMILARALSFRRRTEFSGEENE